MRRSKLPVCLVVLMFSVVRPAAAATVQEARQYVDSIGKHVLDVINTNSKDENEKQKQLRQMFIDNVDITWMGKFVMGAGWRTASEQEKQQYMDAYKQYLLARYTSNFADYTGSKYTITDAKPEENGQFIVYMQIKASSGEQRQETEAGYRVREEGGHFKITDIIVEGVSLITTERADFGSVIQQKGVGALIQDLQAKTEAKQ